MADGQRTHVFISLFLFLQKVKLAAFEEHFAEKVCVKCCVVLVVCSVFHSWRQTLFFKSKYVTRSFTSVKQWSLDEIGFGKKSKKITLQMV